MPRRREGPVDFTAWMAGWKVFRAAMYMLKAATKTQLDAYSKGVEKLMAWYPQDWPSVRAADVQVRKEQWVRLFEDGLAAGRYGDTWGAWGAVIYDSAFRPGFVGPLGGWYHDKLTHALDHQTPTTAPPYIPLVSSMTHRRGAWPTGPRPQRSQAFPLPRRFRLRHRPRPVLAGACASIAVSRGTIGRIARPSPGWPSTPCSRLRPRPRPRPSRGNPKAGNKGGGKGKRGNGQGGNGNGQNQQQQQQGVAEADNQGEDADHRPPRGRGGRTRRTR